MRKQRITTQAVDELERQLLGRTVTLVMADGSKRRMSGRRLVKAIHDLSADRVTADVELVSASVADNAAAMGHGCLTDVIRVLNRAHQELAGLSEQELAALDACSLF